jgi:hypothetical protein
MQFILFQNGFFYWSFELHTWFLRRLESEFGINVFDHLSERPLLVHFRLSEPFDEFLLILSAIDVFNLTFLVLFTLTGLAELVRCRILLLIIEAKTRLRLVVSLQRLQVTVLFCVDVFF